MTWFTLALLSQFSLIAFYFLSKRLLNRGNIDPRLYGACLQLTTGLIALPFAIYTGFNFTLTPTSALLLLGMTATYVIGPSLYYTGLNKVDLSETTILDASGVLWSLLFGVIFLNESFNPSKLIGISLILLAVTILAYNRQLKKITLNRYEIYILISAAFYALGAVFDNKLVEFSTAISYLSISFMLAGIAMFASNLHRLKSVGAQTLLNSSFIKTVAVNGVFTSLTYFFIMTAYTVGGEVSRIYPIQQLESLIVPIIGIVFLKERKRIPQKLIAAALSIAGVLLLR